jgi:hypothetical protein
VAACACAFVGVIFSVKFAAGAWGVLAHLWGAYPARVVTGSVN